MSLMSGGGSIYSTATKIENQNPEEVGKTLIRTLKKEIANAYKSNFWLDNFYIKNSVSDFTHQHYLL